MYILYCKDSDHSPLLLEVIYSLLTYLTYSLINPTTACCLLIINPSVSLWPRALRKYTHSFTWTLVAYWWCQNARPIPSGNQSRYDPTKLWKWLKRDFGEAFEDNLSVKLGWCDVKTKQTTQKMGFVILLVSARSYCSTKEVCKSANFPLFSTLTF
jgi:hypothetical protein